MTQISWLIALIPAFPLAGFLLNVFLVRGERANGTVASLSIVAAFITTVIAVINLAGLAAESRFIMSILAYLCKFRRSLFDPSQTTT